MKQKELLKRLIKIQNEDLKLREPVGFLVFLDPYSAGTGRAICQLSTTIHAIVVFNPFY